MNVGHQTKQKRKILCLCCVKEIVSVGKLHILVPSVDGSSINLDFRKLYKSLYMYFQKCKCIIVISLFTNINIIFHKLSFCNFICYHVEEFPVLN